MSWLSNKTALTAHGTGQGVAQVRVKNKLPLAHLTATVVSEARNAGEMPAGEHHHWFLHPGAGKAWHLRRRELSIRLFLPGSPHQGLS